MCALVVCGPVFELGFVNERRSGGRSCLFVRVEEVNHFGFGGSISLSLFPLDGLQATATPPHQRQPVLVTVDENGSSLGGQDGVRLDIVNPAVEGIPGERQIRQRRPHAKPGSKEARTYEY